MFRSRRRVFFLVMMALALGGVSIALLVTGTKIEQIDGALWKVKWTFLRDQLAADAGRFKVSRTRDRLAYFVFPSSDENRGLDVWLCYPNGSVIRHLHVPQEQLHPVNAISDVGWLTNTRLFAEGHINPSLGRYFDMDLENDAIDGYDGCVFSWDPTKQHLAYAQEPPHFGSPEEAPAKVYIDRNRIGEVPRDGEKRIRWSDDGTNFVVMIKEGDTISAYLAETQSQGSWWIHRFEPSGLR